MKLKKILLLAIIPFLLLIFNSSLVKASSAPYQDCYKWIGHQNGIYLSFNIHRHSASMYENDGVESDTLHYHGFYPAHHGWITPHSNATIPYSFKHINYRTLEIHDVGGYGWLHRYMKRVRHYHLDDTKYTHVGFRQTNNKRLLKKSGYSISHDGSGYTIYNKYSPYDHRAYVPKWVKLSHFHPISFTKYTSPRNAARQLEWIRDLGGSNEAVYDYIGHGKWECDSESDY